MGSMIDAFVQIRHISILFEQRGKHFLGVLYLADQPKADRCASPDLLASDVNLNNSCIRWIELLIGEVGAKHEQRLAVHHGVVAGGKSQECRHSYIEWVVMLDEFFSAYCMHYGRFKTLSNSDQLIMRSFASCSAEDCNPSGSIQNFRCLLQSAIRRTDRRCRFQNSQADGRCRTFTQCNISRHHHNCYTAFGNGRSHGDGQDARHLLRL